MSPACLIFILLSLSRLASLDDLIGAEQDGLRPLDHFRQSLLVLDDNFWIGIFLWDGETLFL